MLNLQIELSRFEVGVVNCDTVHWETLSEILRHLGGLVVILHDFVDRFDLFWFATRNTLEIDVFIAFDNLRGD